MNLVPHLRFAIWKPIHRGEEVALHFFLCIHDRSNPLGESPSARRLIHLNLMTQTHDLKEVPRRSTLPHRFILTRLLELRE